MTNEHDDVSPLKAMRSRLTHKENAVFAGEMLAVKETLNILKMPPKLRHHFYDMAKSAGRPHPIIADFYAVWPTFPVYILYREQKDLRGTASLGSIMDPSKFQNQWFLKSMLRAREECMDAADGRPTCLLIKWPYMNSLMAVHTSAIDDRFPGLRMQYVSKDTNIPRVTVEPYPQFIEYIKDRISYDLVRD